MVTQVVTHTTCRPVLVGRFLANARRHGAVRARPPADGPARAQEPVREDAGPRRRYTGQDQKWRHQGTIPYLQNIKSILILFLSPFTFFSITFFFSL